MTEFAIAKQARPHVGVVADNPLQRLTLKNVLNSYGLNIAVICDPEQLENQLDRHIDQVDCWIFDVHDTGQDFETLDHLIAEAECPMLFGVDKAPSKEDERYISWERRLMLKLEEHLGGVEVTDSEEAIIALDTPGSHSAPLSEPTQHEHRELSDKTLSENVWVLAASLGGPAAVKEFLDEMPSNIRAGFLYAQHVDAHFSKVLTNVLGRHSALDLKAIEQGDQIYDGDVLVVPVDHEIQFKPNGISVEAQEWDGPYGPSIDHLLTNLLKQYGGRCNMIVFSGMGNDGAMLAPQMKQTGCQIWAQTPDSCANGSMPQSIIDLHCNHRVGTPKELAKMFIEYVGCHSVLNQNKN